MYFLLPGTSQDVYGRMLDNLKNLLPNVEQEKILLDFENTAENAFKLAFQTADVKITNKGGQ